MTWKYVFWLKAVINWVESVALLFTDQWIRELLNLKPLANPEYSQLFLVLVFVIGIAYWWVGNDISRNHDIVKFGVYAQSSVFVVLAYHTLVGNVHPLYLIPFSLVCFYTLTLGLNQFWSNQSAEVGWLYTLGSNHLLIFDERVWLNQHLCRNLQLLMQTSNHF